MKARSRRLIVALLTAVLTLSVFSFPREAHATGNGEVTIGPEVANEFLVTKTLDLRDSNIEVYVTDADRDALYEAADKSAYLWLYYTLLLEGRSSAILDEIDRMYLDGIISYEVYRNAWWDSDYWKRQVEEGQIWRKYWQEEAVDRIDPAEDLSSHYPASIPADQISEAGKRLSDETVEALNKLVELGSMKAIISALRSGRLQLPDEVYSDSDDISAYFAMLNGKVEEIYNDKLSDFVTAKLAPKLPVIAEFEVAYEGNTKKVEVDFGAEGQFYDEILSEIHPDDTSIQVTDDSTLLRDNRTLGYHMLMINGGSITASDGSQYSSTGLRDKEGFPGWHWLLEIGDPLGTYAWARYSPAYPNKYTQTFNLHLNPAVVYYYDLTIDKCYDVAAGEAPPYTHIPEWGVAVDLITDIEFDTDGRVLSVTKPIVLADVLRELLAFEPFESGTTYDITLKETGISGSLDGNDIYPDETTYDLKVELKSPGRPLVREAHVVNLVLERADVEVTKVWDDKDNADGLRPAAADFAKSLHLFADGEEVDAAPTVTDNGDGTYTAIWEQLPKFKNADKELVEYTVKEDAIEGYETEIDGLKIINRHTPEEPGKKTVKVSKVDLNGYELNGARIQVLDAEENVVDSWTSGEAPHELELVADETYTFHEEIAPFGYETVTDIEFTVDEKNVVSILTVSTDSDFATAEDDTLIITDSRDLTDAGPVYITKVDEKGDPLPGAKLQLKDKNGNVTDEWVSTTEPHEIKVKPSDYMIVEISAPSGYEKISAIHIVTNEKSEVSIAKDDNNAAFPDGQKIDVVNLPIGYVPPTPPKKEENTKPEKEEPKETPKEEPKSETTPPAATTITPTNTKTTTSTPKTGVEDHMVLYLGLGLLSLTALLALLKRKRA